METLQQIIQYYANLLIIQYNGLPKAQATIALYAQTLLASNIVLQVQNAYDIDTAVGDQLDVIGKYVGVNRFYSEIVLTNYFSLVPQSAHAALPTSPPQWGFGTQATFENYDYNGTLIYDDIVTSTNSLSDSNFRILIKLAILRNNMNFSHEAIDAAMWGLFGDMIRPESTGNMAMQYFIAGAETTLVQAMISKGVLPKPMGVRLSAVINIIHNMFAFTGYDGYESPDGYGFSDYADYATLAGQVLTYSQIVEV